MEVTLDTSALGTIVGLLRSPLTGQGICFCLVLLAYLYGYYKGRTAEFVRGQFEFDAAARETMASQRSEIAFLRQRLLTREAQEQSTDEDEDE